jgi:hypothetical protein
MGISDTRREIAVPENLNIYRSQPLSKKVYILAKLGAYWYRFLVLISSL